jgi:hypothetical protein
MDDAVPPAFCYCCCCTMSTAATATCSKPDALSATCCYHEHYYWARLLNQAAEPGLLLKLDIVRDVLGCCSDACCTWDCSALAIATGTS